MTCTRVDHRTCTSFCSSIGRGCAGAQLAQQGTCSGASVHCNQRITSNTALCQCGEPLAAICPAGQYENEMGACMGCPAGKFHPWIIQDCKSQHNQKWKRKGQGVGRCLRVRPSNAMHNAYLIHVLCLCQATIWPGVVPVAETNYLRGLLEILLRGRVQRATVESANSHGGLSMHTPANTCEHHGIILNPQMMC